MKGVEQSCTLNVSLARTRSARTSVTTRSNVDRIFIASCGSMRPSLIRSSRVSVRARPRLNRSRSAMNFRSFADSRVSPLPAPAIQLVVRRGGRHLKRIATDLTTEIVSNGQLAGLGRWRGWAQWDHVAWQRPGQTAYYFLSSSALSTIYVSRSDTGKKE